MTEGNCAPTLRGARSSAGSGGCRCRSPGSGVRPSTGGSAAAGSGSVWSCVHIWHNACTGMGLHIHGLIVMSSNPALVGVGGVPDFPKTVRRMSGLGFQLCGLRRPPPPQRPESGAPE